MELTRRAALAGVAGATIASAARGDGILAQRKIDVTVVGAGVFGAWTAWHLRRRGMSVRLVDAHGPGNARASSGGESRVIRISYGGDPLYSNMAQRSLAAWDRLSKRQTLPLLHQTGVLWFSPSEDAYMAKSLDWLRAKSVSHDTYSTAQLRRRWPHIAFRDGESGFLEHDSGALMAARAVQSVVADAGLEAVKAVAAAPIKQANGLYRVADHDSRHVVYACGPWLPRLFPEVLGGKIVATRQEVYHFGPAPGDWRFERGLPVWADFNAGDIVYGFPDLEGQGFKIAFDRHGPVVDPETQDRRVSTDGIEAARAYLKQRFPALANAPFIHGRVCQYENSSNGDFLIDRLPGHDRVWLVGGGSGHGFKHGPEVGRRVAAHIADPALAIETRFSLATKATVQSRTVY